MSDSTSRRTVLAGALTAMASSAIPSPIQDLVQQPDEVTLADIASVEKLAGVEFSEEERKRVLATVKSFRREFRVWRAAGIDYLDEPATHFVPLGGFNDPKALVAYKRLKQNVKRPKTDEELAFMSASEQSELIRTMQVSSVELTEMYLKRLKQFGDRLLNVVNLTEPLAVEQAKRADVEIRAGKIRGPLHGLPYGLKDLFAVKNYPTTWGAGPFEHQVLTHNSTVYERLENAGAVLVAKLSMGSLAQGDVWFNGVTKNPWNIKQGSSGSSAGSASATASGLVSFAIGTETLGSIMSPTLRCRVSGHRPTYGRVSRFGAMGLSYTMDKVGPIGRSLRDCAMVFAAICGHDPNDASSVSRDFQFPKEIDWRRLRVGTTMSESMIASDPVLQFLRDKGAEIKSFKFSPVPEGLTTILSVEAASAFEAFTRSGAVHGLTNSAWPDSFRAHRYVSAVDYLQAHRLRSKVMSKFESEIRDFDVIVANRTGGPLLEMTNHTGHPQVMIPFGVDEQGASFGKTLIGRLYDDDRLLSVAVAIQEHFQFHTQHPDMKAVLA